MDKLKFFLEHPVDNVTKEVKISERIPFKFKIRPMTSAEYASMQKRCTVISKNNSTFDSGKFNTASAIACTVDPRFDDAEAIKSAGCNTPTEYITKSLLVGEISALADAIATLSGFTGITEDVSEAKN